MVTGVDEGTPSNTATAALSPVSGVRLISTVVSSRGLIL